MWHINELSHHDSCSLQLWPPSLQIEVRGAALTAPSGGLPASTPAQLHRWHEPKERLQSEGQRWRQQQQQQTRRLRGTKDTAAQQQQQQHGKVTLVVPSRGGIWGTASIEGRNMFLNTQKDVSFHKVGIEILFIGKQTRICDAGCMHYACTSV